MSKSRRERARKRKLQLQLEGEQKTQTSQEQPSNQSSPSGKKQNRNDSKPPHPNAPEAHGIIMFQTQVANELNENKEIYRSTRLEEKAGTLWRVMNETHTLLELNCNNEAFENLQPGDELAKVIYPVTRKDFVLDGEPQIPEGLIYRKKDDLILYKCPGFDLEIYQRSKRERL